MIIQKTLKFDENKKAFRSSLLRKASKPDLFASSGQLHLLRNNYDNHIVYADIHIKNPNQ
jgi:hypothetical protein